MVNYAKIKDIYLKTPAPVRRLAGLFTRLLPIQLMYGRGFAGFHREALTSQCLSRDQIHRRQNELLGRLIRHSYEYVPYYRKLFDELALLPADIRTRDDLKKLPTLTKDDIRRNFEDLVSRNFSDFRPGLVTTSGSTGRKLEFYLDQQAREKEYALIQRQLGWFGVGANARTANFRGDLVHGFARGTARPYEYNPMKKEMSFSTFELGPRELDAFLTVLGRFHPVVVKGFPSALYTLARHAQKRRVVLPRSVKVVLVSSEMVQDGMTQLIERAFGAPLIDWYGASEYLISAGQCPVRRGLHFNEDFGLVELLDESGRDVGPGERGRIVATGLFNYSMPFIRYEQEDLAVRATDDCACGRELMLIDRIEGRKSDTLFATDGREIPHSAFLHYWKHIIEGQIGDVLYAQTVQVSRDQFVIRMVFDDPIDAPRSRAIIEREVKKLLGVDASIRFENLDRLPGGEKWRFIRNEWKEGRA
jgi:phenylacetate-CoA ligase